MGFEKTALNDVLLYTPKIIKDNRGYFFEAYNKKVIENNFVQDNQSKSSFGVLRGLHYQVEPFAQTKLIRVLSGAIFDVIVDLRKSSSTFGKYDFFNLSAENKQQLYIPKGFAHGFYTMSDNTEILYKCDEYYNKEAERCIKFDDIDLNIQWPILTDNDIIVEPLISDKDRNGITFKEAIKEL